MGAVFSITKRRKKKKYPMSLSHSFYFHLWGAHTGISFFFCAVLFFSVDDFTFVLRRCILFLRAVIARRFLSFVILTDHGGSVQLHQSGLIYFLPIRAKRKKESERDLWSANRKQREERNRFRRNWPLILVVYFPLESS